MRDAFILSAVIICLSLTGCAVHQATESDMARWHGFLESERVKSAELTPLTRCYQRGNGPIKCYDTAWENSEKRLFHE